MCGAIWACRCIWRSLSAGAAQVLVLAEVGERVSVEQADFVWYTPAQKEQDHCEQLRMRKP